MTASGNRMPRVIHHMWIDRNEYDNEDVPPEYERYKHYRATWRQHNPSFEMRFWNRRRVEHMWDTEPALARWRPLSRSLQYHIEKCDLARYALLYVHGGLYLDADFICRRPIDTLFEGRTLGLVREPQTHCDDAVGCGRLVANNFMMSAPGHPFWRAVLDHITENYDPRGRVLTNTGPVALGIVAERYRLPPETYIATCLIFTHDWSDIPNRQCSRDAPNHAYVYTRWHLGSGWQAKEPLGLSGDPNARAAASDVGNITSRTHNNVSPVSDTAIAMIEPPRTLENDHNTSAWHHPSTHTWGIAWPPASAAQNNAAAERRRAGCAVM